MHHVDQTTPLYPPSENKGEDSPYLWGFPSAPNPRRNPNRTGENHDRTMKNMRPHTRDPSSSRSPHSLILTVYEYSSRPLYSLPSFVSFTLSPKKTLLCFVSLSHSSSSIILLLVWEEPLRNSGHPSLSLSVSGLDLHSFPSVRVFRDCFKLSPGENFEFFFFWGTMKKMDPKDDEKKTSTTLINLGHKILRFFCGYEFWVWKSSDFLVCAGVVGADLGRFWVKKKGHGRL